MKVRAPETKQQGKKEMSVPPSPYYKRSRLMEKWNLIQNQPLLCQRFTKPPIISHKKGKSWQRTCLLEPKYQVNLRRSKLSMRVISCGFISRNT